MNISGYISQRISVSKAENKKSPTLFVAITGVALSITIMLIAPAILAGFKNNIISKLEGINSHISLQPTYKTDDIASRVIIVTPELESILNSAPFVKHWSLTASTPAVFKTDDNFKGIYLRGFDKNYNFSTIKSNIIDGKLPDFSKAESQNKIIISKQIANQLNVSVGDKLDTYFISSTINVRPLRIAAIYNSQLEDYDNVYVFCNISVIQDISNFQSNEGSAIEIMTDNLDNVGYYANNLSALFADAEASGKLSHPIKIDTIERWGSSYFSWLSLLDTNVIIILTLMILVASFTIISCLLMMILERVRFIGILKSIGASNGLISQIFIHLAMRIALIGIGVGNVVALSLLYLQQHTHIVALNPESYYIDYVPIHIDWTIIALIDIAAFIIIYSVLILPSRQIAKISPADVMKYE